MLDARKKPIKMDVIATAPRAVDDEHNETKLLKANFRLGETVSKPILSPLEVMDKGAECWLSAKSGMCTYPGGDEPKEIPLTRKHNTLGFNGKTFKTDYEAKEFAASVNANEQEEEFRPSPGAAGSGGAPGPLCGAERAPSATGSGSGCRT